MERPTSTWALAREFAKDEDGNVTIFSVYMILLILLVSGAAVDIMRFEATRAQLQTTMDRAVLAAADLDQVQTSDAVVRDYLEKSGMNHVLLGTEVTSGLNHRTVKAWGESDMATLFLKMSGYDNLTPPAISVAEEKISNVEISLVLDISGSMRFNDRMVKLKPAAQAFVSKVMAENTDSVTTLNLVPFAGQVNPGDILFDYFRGERPKQKQNNGWGNGDQDAPGGSLCNNNAENYDEGLADPSCTDGSAPAPVAAGYFPAWEQDISNIVVYFDTDGDDVYNRAHKIEDFPDNGPRDADDFFRGAVAYMIAQDNKITDPSQFLGISIKGGTQKTRYFQVKGDQNGAESDLGPTKNKGKIPGNTYSFGGIDYVAWEPSYVPPSPEEQPDPEAEPAEPVNINMPGSCIEIYGSEFTTTDMPLSDDYVSHFMYWPIANDVMDWGWCPGEDTAIQYYSDNEAALNAFIADMRMHDGTGTHYGMKYGLALLDPNNRDEVSHLIANGLVAPRFEGRPIDWHDPETEKYIVLMTDGQTTDQFRPNDPRDPINGETELQVQGGASYHTLTSQSANVAYLQQQCDLAKAQGVTVFTIAFETSSDATNDMLQCASSASHFFHVQGDEIADTFDTIARQINNLRLIQ
ncbi:pilus assembly protein TadG-related protein [Antarctobacter jejuensis]|uniref:pilus assembly protein TadG-related protein n=1 Tax=Antarctobacter jejuensis TaxID=1439938 RepID=UPI003FD6738B